MEAPDEDLLIDDQTYGATSGKDKEYEEILRNYGYKGPNTKIPLPSVVIKPVFGGRTIQFHYDDDVSDGAGKPWHIVYNPPQTLAVTDTTKEYPYTHYRFYAAIRYLTSGYPIGIDEPIFINKAIKQSSDGVYDYAVYGYELLNNNYEACYSRALLCRMINPQLDPPKIVQSGKKSDNNFKVYSEAKDSYIVYTLNGTTPKIEEGTNKLKITNGRIIWGTSAVIHVPENAVLTAITIRCGLVTSDPLIFANVPRLPDPIKYGLEDTIVSGSGMRSYLYYLSSPLPTGSEMSSNRISVRSVGTDKNAVINKCVKYIQSLKGDFYLLPFSSSEIKSLDDIDYKFFDNYYKRNRDYLGLMGNAGMLCSKRTRNNVSSGVARYYNAQICWLSYSVSSTGSTYRINLYLIYDPRNYGTNRGYPIDGTYSKFYS